MDGSSLFTEDFAEEPWWWRTSPPMPMGAGSIPSDVDVAVVGSGITGLSAAIHLARAGRSVIVFDAERPGYGASTRNFGVIGRSLQHSFTGLMAKFGEARATTVYRELHAAFQSVLDLLSSENISCDFRMAGRFNMAVSERHFSALEREYDAQRRHLGVDAEMVDRRDQHSEIAIAGDYHGGVLIRDLGLLDPGRYHEGLLKTAASLGAQIAAETPVLGLRPEASSVEVRLSNRVLRARDVVVATNGYTSPATPWLRRRLVPFSSFVIATEELPAALVQRLLPGNRNFTEATRNPFYMRQSPDGRRILFGGLTGPMPRDGLRAVAARLVVNLNRMLPNLGTVRISNVWSGKCAGTFDRYPHLVTRDRVHYAAGYCFAGLPMGTYFGKKVADRIAGSTGGDSLFSERRFPTLPFYNGSPWFLPALFRHYARQDAALRKS